MSIAVKFGCGHAILPRIAFPSGRANPPPLTLRNRVPRSRLECRVEPVNDYWKAKIDEYEGELAYLDRKLAHLNALYTLVIDSDGDADAEAWTGLMDEVKVDREEIPVQIVRAKADCQAEAARLQEKIKGTWIAAL